MSRSVHPRPRILFFGDPHGDFRSVIRAVECHHPEAIILLGDIQARKPLHLELATIRHQTDIWFIHGNHDTDSDADYDNLWGSELADRNLHGRVETVAGFKVAGLGGIFREKIWHPEQPIDDATFESPERLLRQVNWSDKARTLDTWRAGISRRHRSTIFPSDFNALAGLDADILVTHEAPSAHRHGFRVVDELAISLGVELLVHGHHHESIDYLAEGKQDRTSSFRVFGVDKGDHLAWPLQQESWP
ncbi:metallophosphoesterase family protein [Variovorax rhizosphaerae]|uniref:Metallophosphoesterase n=1 Tax=Variovorax rhizosphaerae TaxID=1836200 RepID=A0ABU8WTD9_9BURK